MSAPTFTPSDVVRRYLELGVTPRTGATNVMLDDQRRWVARRPGCGHCAMGVMLLGTEAPQLVGDLNPLGDMTAQLVDQQLGVHFESFYEGFDYDSDQFSPDGDRVSYDLGRACREAVLADPVLTAKFNVPSKVTL